MRKLKGFTLIELLIVVAIIAILAAIAVPNFLEAQVRSKVSRVKADHRSIATALETYYLDNNQYPAMAGISITSNDQNASGIATDLGANTQLAEQRTFRLRGPDQLATLTTPVAYITSYFADPFADTRGLPFRFYRDRSGYLLGSYGPDADQGTGSGGDLIWGFGSDILSNPPEANSIETVYDSRTSQPSLILLTQANTAGESGGAFTYDPTNGTVSQGDVWRVKD